MPFDVGTVAWQALLNPYLGFDGVHMSRDGAGVGEGRAVPFRAIDSPGSARTTVPGHFAGSPDRSARSRSRS